jgi:hypothetical protein
MSGRRISGVVSRVVDNKFNKTDFAEALYSALSMARGHDVSHEEVAEFVNSERVALGMKHVNLETACYRCNGKFKPNDFEKHRGECWKKVN